MVASILTALSQVRFDDLVAKDYSLVVMILARGRSIVKTGFLTPDNKHYYVKLHVFFAAKLREAKIILYFYNKW